MVHFIQAENTERPLNCETGFVGAGVETPLRGDGVESLGIYGQTGRRIVLRVDRDGHHPYLIALLRQFVLQRGEDLAHHRTDRGATRKYEIQIGWTRVLKLFGQVDLDAVFAHQGHSRDFCLDDRPFDRLDFIVMVVRRGNRRPDHAGAKGEHHDRRAKLPVHR